MNAWWLIELYVYRSLSITPVYDYPLEASSKCHHTYTPAIGWTGAMCRLATSRL